MVTLAEMLGPGVAFGSVVSVYAVIASGSSVMGSTAGGKDVFVFLQLRDPTLPWKKQNSEEPPVETVTCQVYAPAPHLLPRLEGRREYPEILCLHTVKARPETGGGRGTCSTVEELGCNVWGAPPRCPLERPIRDNSCFSDCTFSFVCDTAPVQKHKFAGSTQLQVRVRPARTPQDGDMYAVYPSQVAPGQDPAQPLMQSQGRDTPFQVGAKARQRQLGRVPRRGIDSRAAIMQGSSGAAIDQREGAFRST